MGITYGDRLIDSGHNDITPEQEREIEAREECARRGIDPDEICADGGVTAWTVVDQERRNGLSLSDGVHRLVALGYLREDAEDIVNERIAEKPHPMDEGLIRTQRTMTIAWLRDLAAKGGRGAVNNIDARCLGRIADDLERIDQLEFSQSTRETILAEENKRLRALSAPPVRSSLPSGENDPVAMQDYSGAETAVAVDDGVDEIIALADSLKDADGVACIVHEVPCEMHRTTFLTYEQIDVIGTALKMMVGRL